MRANLSTTAELCALDTNLAHQVWLDQLAGEMCTDLSSSPSLIASTGALLERKVCRGQAGVYVLQTILSLVLLKAKPHFHIGVQKVCLPRLSLAGWS